MDWAVYWSQYSNKRPNTKKAQYIIAQGNWTRISPLIWTEKFTSLMSNKLRHARSRVNSTTYSFESSRRKSGVGVFPTSKVSTISGITYNLSPPLSSEPDTLLLHRIRRRRRQSREPMVKTRQQKSKPKKQHPHVSF